MSLAARQLPLPFIEKQVYAEEDFCVAPCNALARSWLEKPAAWTNGRMVLWGEPGCGKSYMLHLWAQSAGAVIYQGHQLRGLAELPSTAVAVDDADVVPEEAALLHLLNAASEAGHPLLLTSQAPPARLDLRLPDLASRLRSSLTVEISPPDDAMLGLLLFRLASARQIVLSDPVSQFLLTRLPRTPAALREAVARLDHANLTSGSKITRALAAQILADLIDP
jgi:chromosomal replication initiation ATPase DnaA